MRKIWKILNRKFVLGLSNTENGKFKFEMLLLLWSYFKCGYSSD